MKLFNSANAVMEQMELSMKGYMFEGTPQEVIQAMMAMQGSVEAIIVTTPVASTSQSAVEEVKFATTEVARKVFSRRPLSEEQKKILCMLAQSYPRWILITELQAAVNYSPAQFAGLLGAFGRRHSHTDGYVTGSWLFDAEWDEGSHCYRYRLPDSVREAVRLEGIA